MELAVPSPASTGALVVVPASRFGLATVDSLETTVGGCGGDSFCGAGFSARSARRFDIDRDGISVRGAELISAWTTGGDSGFGSGFAAASGAAFVGFGTAGGSGSPGASESALGLDLDLGLCSGSGSGFGFGFGSLRGLESTSTIGGSGRGDFRPVRGFTSGLPRASFAGRGETTAGLGARTFVACTTACLPPHCGLLPSSSGSYDLGALVCRFGRLVARSPLML